VKSIDASGGPLERVAVWDLPTRLFHWALVALIAFSWWTAEEDYLDLHLYSGLAVCTLLLFRLLWGVFGSSTARFAHFVRGPRTLWGYLRDMKAWAGIGHSPLGALSVLALLAVLLFQVGTGLFQTDDDGLIEGPLAPFVSYDVSEAAHDLHELGWTALQVLIVLHVGAILFYRLALGKKLVGPMISGRAELSPGTEPLRRARPWTAILCLLAALGLTRLILAVLPPLL
jgi:cytochrome b